LTQTNTTFFEKQLARRTFQGATFIALMREAPTVTGAGGAECAGGGYVRRGIEFGPPTAGAVSNTFTVLFPTPTAAWGTVTHWALFDAPVGGALLCFDEFASPISAPIGSEIALADGTISVAVETQSAGASSPPVYQKSVTDPDGNVKTFDFTDPIVTLIAAFVGGIAQLPADCSVVAGDLVLGAGVDAPPAGETGVVTALFVK
jgi:hypothetical protein